MRFIIREQEFEKPVAAGALRREIDGNTTGTVEFWRVTEVHSGFSFLRIDIDGRDGARELDTLYHLTLNARREIERVKFRHFIYPDEIKGDLQMSNQEVALNHTSSEGRFEQVADWSDATCLWFPGALGLALLVAQANDRRQVPSVYLNAENGFVLEETWVSLDPPSMEEVAVCGRQIPAQRHSISLRNKDHTVWVDQQGWPIRVESSTGFVAMETHYVRFGKQ